MEYGVYTPPGWHPGESLPLVVFLHTVGSDVRCLDDAGVPALLDREIIAGRTPPVVILVPEGDRGFWMNWYDGTRRYEDWVLRELMPSIQQQYGTRPCPGGCHLMGISMGGNGALRWALEYPNTFSSVEVLSGPIPDTAGMVRAKGTFIMHLVAPVDRIFGPDSDLDRLRVRDPYQRWHSPADLGGTRLYVARGVDDHDWIIETNDVFRSYLVRHGIPHQYVVFPGGHRWAAWKALFPDVLRFAVRPRPVTGQQAPSFGT